MRVAFAFALAAALVAGSAHGGESYLLEKDEGPGLTAPVASFAYSERFSVLSVSVGADGREVAAVTRTSPEGIRAWRLSDGRGGRVPTASGTVSTLTYANVSPHVALAVVPDVLSGREGRIELVDLSTGRAGPVLEGAEDVRAIAFSPDDQVVLAALPEGVRAWDLREGSSRDLFRLRGGADTVSFSAADEAFVSAERGAIIYRIRVPDGEVLEQWKGKPAGGPIAISPGGGVLAAATGSGAVKLHDLKAGGKPAVLEIGSPVTSVDWAAGGGLLAVGTESGEVRVYSVDADTLPMGFQETPRMEGRGGGVSGRWDGEDRTVTLDRRDDRRDDRDRAADRRDDARIDLDMGRDDRGLGLGRGAGGPAPRGESPGDLGRGREAAAASGPTDIAITPRVVVLDQMGGDPRDAGDLERKLRANEKRLKRCWRVALRAGEPAVGTVVYEMGISPNGEGVGIEQPLEDTIGSAKLTECLDGRLREALFGPGLGSMDIRLQLDFAAAP